MTTYDGPVIGSELPIVALANDQVIAVAPDTSIRVATETMSVEEVGLLVLADESGIAGVVSERDVVHAVAEGVDLDGPVSTIGSAGAVHWAPTDATVAEVAAEMMQTYVRHILVAADDGTPAGVVSMRDLLAVIVD